VSKKLDDLTGRIFGSLTVIRRAPNRASSSVRWIAKCECGTEVDTQANGLRDGTKTSCSADACPFWLNRKVSVRGHTVGARFGSLVVESYILPNNARGTMAVCRCDCGGSKTVRTRSLKSGQTKTCGCGTGVFDRFNFNGRELTARAIAKEVGVNQHALRRFLSRGVPVAEAVASAVSSRGAFDARIDTSVFGQRLTLEQLAAISGLSKKRVVSQIKRGLTAEDVASGKRRPIATALKLDGKRFGRLVVREYAGIHHKRAATLWTCTCDCGRSYTVVGADLMSGHTASCGCAVKDRIGALRRGQKKSP